MEIPCGQSGEQLVAEAWRFTSFFLAKLRDEADTIAEGAYRKALAKDPAMPIRAKIFAADLTFEVLSSPPGEFFILGDCGPVAMFTDGKPRLVLGALSNDAEIETLLLPTSPTRCIVGRLPSATSRLSVTDINRISAALSLEFFISDRDMGEELEELRTSIGSLVPVDTEDDIIRAMLNEQD